MILEIEGVSCSVPGRTLFEGLSISIAAGENVAVMGPSGSGKSTLLAAILGMTPVSAGKIQICGDVISGIGRNAAAEIRRNHIGVVFQNGELFPELTAAENVGVALMLAQPHSSTNKIEFATELLNQVDVPPATRAGDLSGGERQRTAVVRALATSPDLVLADEPTGSLDSKTRDAVSQMLFATVKERNAALLVVTHDPVVANTADRVINLDDFQV